VKVLEPAQACRPDRRPGYDQRCLYGPTEGAQRHLNVLCSCRHHLRLRLRSRQTSRASHPRRTADSDPFRPPKRTRPTTPTKPMHKRPTIVWRIAQCLTFHRALVASRSKVLPARRRFARSSQHRLTPECQGLKATFSLSDLSSVTARGQVDARGTGCSRLTSRSVRESLSRRIRKEESNTNAK